MEANAEPEKFYEIFYENSFTSGLFLKSKVKGGAAQIRHKNDSRENLSRH